MITIRNLLGRKAVTRADRTAMPISEVFFQERTGHLRYVALSAGGMFNRKDILVAIGRFGPPEEGASTWDVTIDTGEIEEAPAWQHEPERTPMALEAWPPIITGPFGYTTSPLLMYAAYAESAGAHEPEQPATPPDPRLNRLERATQRMGAEVFGEDGLLGRLDDLAVDSKTLSITDFLVDGRKVPYTALRHMAEEGEHTVLDLDRSRLSALPAV